VGDQQAPAARHATSIFAQRTSSTPPATPRPPSPGAHPWGGHRAVFTAAGTVNREDWGLTWNLPLDGGRLLVSTQIRIEIELEAVLQPGSTS
jgi:hypothetical protein